MNYTPKFKPGDTIIIDPTIARSISTTANSALCVHNRKVHITGIVVDGSSPRYVFEDVSIKCTWNWWCQEFDPYFKSLHQPFILPEELFEL